MLSLLRLGRKHKNHSTLFGIRIILFLSYSFGIKTIKMFIYSRSSLENPTRFQTPEWAKCQPVFRPKRRKNPTQWGGTYLYGVYKGVPPPAPREKHNDLLIQRNDVENFHNTIFLGRCNKRLIHEFQCFNGNKTAYAKVL